MRAPRLTYDDIRSEAVRFLGEYHPTGELPIPIENIVEMGLRLAVVLEEMRDAYGISGYLTQDRLEIRVDPELLHDRLETHYRFTLAHEVGHYVLHGEAYAYASRMSLDEWRQAVLSGQMGDPWFDSHADAFAGLVLVPGQHLFGSLLSSAVDKIGTERLAEALGVAEHTDIVLDRFSRKVCEHLARHFRVNWKTIQIRLVREHRWPIVNPDGSIYVNSH